MHTPEFIYGLSQESDYDTGYGKAGYFFRFIHQLADNINPQWKHAVD